MVCETQKAAIHPYFVSDNSILRYKNPVVVNNRRKNCDSFSL